MHPTPIAFSIVIPTHGGRQSVRQAVQSVLRQTHSNLEVIVVADGEPLRAAELLADVEDPRVRLIPQAQLGAAHARNRGVENAANDWIAFLDDDDKARSNWLASLASVITDQTLAATGSVCYWEGSASTVRECRLSLTDPTMEASTILAGGFCVRRGLLEEVGGYDTTLKAAQNQDLGLRLCDHILRRGIPGEITKTSDVLVDVFVESASSRAPRYGTSRGDSARIFMQRYKHRLGVDPRHEASLLRIIARSERARKRNDLARAAAVRACRRERTNWQNYRSLALAVLPSLERPASSLRSFVLDLKLSTEKARRRGRKF